MLDDALLAATTRERFLPLLKEQIYDAMPLLRFFMDKGRVQDFTGRALIWNSVARRHEAIAQFKGYSPIPNQPANPLDTHTLTNSNYVATIALDLETELLNRGKAGAEFLVSALQTQMKNAENTLRETMAYDFWGAGTPVGQFQPIIGIAAAIDTDNTYAGIDRTATGKTYWHGQRDDTSYAYANVIDSTNAAYLPRIMDTMWTNCTHNGPKGAPDAIFTTKNLYNLYRNITRSFLRITSQASTAGFRGTEFNDGTMLTFDDYATANYMAFLNSNDWAVHVIPDANFDFAPGQNGMWKYPTNQLAKLAHLIWIGQLKCDTPRRQGLFTAIQTS